MSESSLLGRQAEERAAAALRDMGYKILARNFRGSAGEIGGLLGGACAMGLVLTLAFDAPRAIGKVVVALFVLNALGYYIGGRLHGKLAIDHRALGMLLWGVCYGVGLGAGLGLAFYSCQERVRAALRGVAPGAAGEA